MKPLWFILLALLPLAATKAQTADSAGVLHFSLGNVEFEMIPVEGGTFMMGTNVVDKRKPTYEAERPAHEVTIGSFYMSRFEVTQPLWVAVMGSNPSQWQDNDSLPVEQVSWTAAQNFVTLLSQMLGYTFRLPTEAEWEYAAKGGNQRQPAISADNLYDHAWYCANSK